VASFKDETSRVTSDLQMAAQYNAEIVTEGKQIAGTMQKLLVQGEYLLTELRLIKGCVATL
jgi:hypothetical protein